MNVFVSFAGKPCLAQWSDEQYYRAVVTEVIVPGKVIVRFVDFGNKAEISWEKVVQIPDHLLKYPEQVGSSFCQVRWLKFSGS